MALMLLLDHGIVFLLPLCYRNLASLLPLFIVEHGLFITSLYDVNLVILLTGHIMDFDVAYLAASHGFTIIYYIALLIEHL